MKRSVEMKSDMAVTMIANHLMQPQNRNALPAQNAVDLLSELVAKHTGLDKSVIQPKVAAVVADLETAQFALASFSPEVILPHAQALVGSLESVGLKICAIENTRAFAEVMHSHGKAV